MTGFTFRAGILLGLAALLFFGCTPGSEERPDTRPSDTPATSESGDREHDEGSAETHVGTTGSILARRGDFDQPAGPPREAWRYTATAPATASPVTIGDLVVVGFADFTIRGLSTADGSVQWELATETLPVSLATSAAGLFAAEQGSLSRIAVEDGATVWSLPVETAASARILATSRAVYVPTANGTIVAVSTESGEAIWSADLDQASQAPVVGNIAALDGVLYACVADGAVAAVVAADGAVRWTTRSGGVHISGPTVTADGAIVVNAHGAVSSYLLATGERTPVAQLSSPILTSPISDGALISVLDASGRFVRLNVAETGSAQPPDSAAISESSTRGVDLAGQPALLGDRILVADATGGLRGLDSSTGEEVWSVALYLRAVGQMAFDGNAVYVAGASGELLALVFDETPASVLPLSDDRVWEIPPDGQFRMATRLVEFRIVAERSVVTEWTITSDQPDDELVVTVTDAAGNLLATNMGKVVLESTVRTAVVAGQEFRLRIERAYPDPQVVVGLTSKTVE